MINKRGETIASAITNLDIHDIARASKTFGAKGFFIVTPVKDQQYIAKRIISHWTHGAGGEYNPNRQDALQLIYVVDTLDDILLHIQNNEGQMPKTVSTCAGGHSRCISYDKVQSLIQQGLPYLFLFGTAWGMSHEIIDKSDYILEPIKGKTDYNHLSVRSAVSITLDRLLGLRS